MTFGLVKSCEIPIVLIYFFCPLHLFIMSHTARYRYSSTWHKHIHWRAILSKKRKKNSTIYQYSWMEFKFRYNDSISGFIHQYYLYAMLFTLKMWTNAHTDIIHTQRIGGKNLNRNQDKKKRHRAHASFAHTLSSVCYTHRTMNSYECVGARLIAV